LVRKVFDSSVAEAWKQGQRGGDGRQSGSGMAYPIMGREWHCISNLLVIVGSGSEALLRRHATGLDRRDVSGDSRLQAHRSPSIDGRGSVGMGRG
jgi:hypothetical protein